MCKFSRAVLLKWDPFWGIWKRHSHTLTEKVRVRRRLAGNVLPACQCCFSPTTWLERVKMDVFVFHRHIRVGFFCPFVDNVGQNIVFSPADPPFGWSPLPPRGYWPTMTIHDFRPINCYEIISLKRRLPCALLLCVIFRRKIRNMK